jgi:hypothetical protein
MPKSLLPEAVGPTIAITGGCLTVEFKWLDSRGSEEETEKDDEPDEQEQRERAC